eukprot:2370402-Rhodomonas_salina.1
MASSRRATPADSNSSCFTPARTSPDSSPPSSSAQNAAARGGSSFPPLPAALRGGSHPLVPVLGTGLPSPPGPCCGDRERRGLPGKLPFREVREQRDWTECRLARSWKRGSEASSSGVVRGWVEESTRWRRTFMLERRRLVAMSSSSMMRTTTSICRKIYRRSCARSIASNPDADNPPASSHSRKPSVNVWKSSCDKCIAAYRGSFRKLSTMSSNLSDPLLSESSTRYSVAIRRDRSASSS